MRLNMSASIRTNLFDFFLTILGLTAGRRVLRAEGILGERESRHGENARTCHQSTATQSSYPTSQAHSQCGAGASLSVRSPAVHQPRLCAAPSFKRLSTCSH
jgi:hypothetical protein